MVDRPIIFSSAMIRALMDGRKTQTRRILKPWNHEADLKGCTWRLASGYKTTKADPPYMEAVRPTSYGATEIVVGPRRVPCRPGDRLWVRENFAVHKNAEPRVYQKGDGHPWGSPIYKATFGGGLAPVCEGFSPWKSSIHIPRWASRLTLNVEGVKVERLQDISEEDARAEGFPINHNGEPYEVAPVGSVRDWNNYGRASFFLYWSQLHSGESLDANPWVAAISFRVVKANIDALCEEAAP